MENQNCTPPLRPKKMNQASILMLYNARKINEASLCMLLNHHGRGRLPTTVVAVVLPHALTSRSAPVCSHWLVAIVRIVNLGIRLCHGPPRQHN
jgi:hypothetical protein